MWRRSQVVTVVPFLLVRSYHAVYCFDHLLDWLFVILCNRSEWSWDFVAYVEICLSKSCQ